jgi:predicted flap endonuclease-1-like 5' DNA nuclease
LDIKEIGRNFASHFSIAKGMDSRICPAKLHQHRFGVDISIGRQGNGRLPNYLSQIAGVVIIGECIMLEACGSWLPYILGALFVGFLTAWWMWGRNKTPAAADHSGHNHSSHDHIPTEKEAPVAAKPADNADTAAMAIAGGAMAAAAVGTAAVTAKAKPKAKSAPVKTAPVQKVAAPKTATATVKKPAVKAAPVKATAPAKAAPKATAPKAKVTAVKSVAVKARAKAVPVKAPKAKPVAAPAALKATPKAAAKPAATKSVAAKPVMAKPAATKPVAAKAVAKPKPKAAAKPKIIIPDNLELLKGVGPKLNDLLKSMGVTSFEQVANWKPSDIREIDSKLGNFAGRIGRDNWVDQAKLLIKGDVKGFEKKYGTLGSEINRG